jgi:hypothetical protein
VASRPFPLPAAARQHVDPSEPTAIQYHRSAKYDLMSQAVDIAPSWMRDDFRQYLDGYYGWWKPWITRSAVS